MSDFCRSPELKQYETLRAANKFSERPCCWCLLTRIQTDKRQSTRRPRRCSLSLRSVVNDRWRPIRIICSAASLCFILSTDIAPAKKHTDCSERERRGGRRGGAGSDRAERIDSRHAREAITCDGKKFRGELKGARVMAAPPLMTMIKINLRGEGTLPN